MSEQEYPSGPLRPRRLRLSAGLRDMVRETRLHPSDFIYPVFVRPGDGEPRPIASMPGQFQWPLARVHEPASKAIDAGVPAVILFGIPDSKDAQGSDNFSANGIVPEAIRRLKEANEELVVISDMCFCEYTDHGHCGVINDADSDDFRKTLPSGYVLNDETLELLARASAVHAEAGADIIAPSGMIDGMVNAIRHGLDIAGFDHIPIMSYAAKYASAFYGPFRDAAESPPTFGDRSQYQMDPANRREAAKEIELDVIEGADILMVKPALPYLDIIRELRDRHQRPVAAYQVSGEFAMLHAAAERGWIDLERAAVESLTCIKRAGADLILTYFALDAVGWID
jgi:porphobilinogen synthase